MIGEPGSRDAAPGGPDDGAERASSASDEPGAPADAAVKRRRRASRPAPEGSDPEPYDPPTEQRSERENDARLLGDRPPHWG